MVNDHPEDATAGEGTAKAKLWYLGHVVAENRHGLLVNVRVTQAYGQAEREAALAMAKGPRPAGSCRERGHAALQFGAWLDEQAGGAVRWTGGRCGTRGTG